MSLVSQSIAAAKTPDKFALLFLNDDRETVPNGQLISFINYNKPNGLFREYSNENRINCVWASPEGNFWMGDGVGNVIASGSHNLPEKKPVNLDGSNDVEYQYQVQHSGMGSIDLIWGTSDRNVWMYSAEGRATNYNGKNYTTHELAPDLNFLTGLNENFIIAGGDKSNLWFYNGNKWAKIELDLNEEYYLNEVYIQDTDTIYIVSRNGIILKGNITDGFTQIVVPEYSFYDIQEYRGKLYVSGGTALYELINDDEIKTVSDQVSAILLYNQGDSLWIITADIHESTYPMITLLRDVETIDFEIYLPYSKE